MDRKTIYLIVAAVLIMIIIITTLVLRMHSDKTVVPVPANTVDTGTTTDGSKNKLSPYRIVEHMSFKTPGVPMNVGKRTLTSIFQMMADHEVTAFSLMGTQAVISKDPSPLVLSGDKSLLMFMHT